MIKYDELSNSSVAIYINFPFCKYPCTYCHYVKNLEFGYDAIPDIYFEKIVRQLQEILVNLKNKRINSIYFGGGTPSLLKDEQIEIIKELFVRHKMIVEEISIEIHPGMCNFDYINNSFFTRYSIGVQTICQEIAEEYHRTTYNKDHVSSMIKNIRKSKFPKVINFDFIIDEIIDNDEISFVNTIQPETVTFYPNTQGRGIERLRNVLKSLKKIQKLLSGYTALAKSKYIYIKTSCKQSNYSKIEYEQYGNIIGVGHNSVSYIENDSYLCLYDDDKIIIKKRQGKGDRLLIYLLMGITTGVTKKNILKIIPEIYDKHFLLTVNDELDVSDKHISVKDHELVFLPEMEYIRFYEYIRSRYYDIYSKVFLSAIGYGDSDYLTINQVYNSEFMVLKDNTVQIKKKIKLPKLRILVEGIDGSGKDTFVRFFVNELKRHFYFGKNSRISVTGQPDSTCKNGIEAKRFIEDLVVLYDKESIRNILCSNRYESEQRINSLVGTVILIRGIVTDKATFEHKFGENAYLGEGKYIKKWDMLIVVDTEVEKANYQIENRGIARTWREYPEYLKYFREYYLDYNSPIFNEKIIIRNDKGIDSLKNKAMEMVEEIYEQYKDRKY